MNKADKGDFFDLFSLDHILSQSDHTHRKSKIVCTIGYAKFLYYVSKFVFLDLPVGTSTPSLACSKEV